MITVINTSDVRCMHAHRIGVHNKTSVTAAQGYQSETRSAVAGSTAVPAQFRQWLRILKSTALQKGRYGQSAGRRRPDCAAFPILALVQYQTDSELMTLKQAIVRIKVRNRYEMSSISMMRNIGLLLVAVLHMKRSPSMRSISLHGLSGIAARFQFQLMAKLHHS